MGILLFIPAVPQRAGPNTLRRHRIPENGGETAEPVLLTAHGVLPYCAGLRLQPAHRVGPLPLQQGAAAACQPVQDTV